MPWKPYIIFFSKSRCNDQREKKMATRVYQTKELIGFQVQIYYWYQTLKVPKTMDYLPAGAAVYF